MLQQAERTLQEVLDAFDFGGQVAGVLRYGQGHINDTFCVYVQQADGDGKRSVLQRINTDTFRDPAGLMENIVASQSICGVWCKKRVVTPSEKP